MTSDINLFSPVKLGSYTLPNMNCPGIYSPEQVAGWRLVTDAVHERGGRIFLQLWHCGRISHPSLLGGELPVAPSAIAAVGELHTSVNGQTLLVTGGAGAVGYYALQLAKWGGATVITTVSRPEQAELVQAAGADHIINYKTEDVVKRIKEITGAEDGRGIDRIVDVHFGANLPITSTVLRANGVVATYASGGPDDRPAFPSTPFLTNGITIRFVFTYIMPEAAKKAAVRDITAALEAGALRHNIARRFPIAEVAAAHEAQDSGKMIGKAIIEIT